MEAIQVTRLGTFTPKIS